MVGLRIQFEGVGNQKIVVYEIDQAFLSNSWGLWLVGLFESNET